MKQTLLFLILFILIAFGLSACKKKPAPAVVEPAVENQDVDISKLLPLEGNWVVADYLPDLQKTKSPYRSYPKLVGESIIRINSRNAGPDGFLIETTTNYHQNASYKVPYAKGSNNQSYVIMDGVELEYSVVGADTSLYWVEKSRPDKLSNRRKFVKFEERIPNRKIDDQINSILVSGDYTYRDSSYVVRNVSMDDIGAITGFEHYSTYHIQADFSDNPGMDIISFDDVPDYHEEFHFKVKTNSLELYNITTSADNKVRLGSLAYIFNRKY